MGMLIGTLVQTIALVMITSKTDWDEQVPLQLLFFRINYVVFFQLKELEKIIRTIPNIFGVHLNRKIFGVHLNRKILLLFIHAPLTYR